MPIKRSTVLMVPPDSFQYNFETAATNSFQSEIHIYNLREKALEEFYSMVSMLRTEGINVLILNQNKLLPDAVFPNNWFSTHVDASGKNILIIYPMLAKNRQQEVNLEGLMKALNSAKFEVDQIIDLRNTDNEILEGTGSLVLDHQYRLLYASLSERTSSAMVGKVAQILNYRPIVFTSSDEHFYPIYHTNVIMGIAKEYVIVCLDAVKDPIQRSAISHGVQMTNKLVIEISLEQVRHMCGNVLELYNNRGESVLVLSAQAQQNFTEKQLDTIQRYSKLLPIQLETIETVGGGGARCMMAEINYPQN